MSRTEPFRIQHKELAEVIGKMEKILIPGELAKDKADEMRTLLSTLAGKITIHLAMEDKALYPKMVASGNPEAKKMAEEYAREMGGLAEAFKAYVGKWSSSTQIKASPDDFCKQTKDVFALLKARIGREESTLYVLADKI